MFIFFILFICKISIHALREEGDVNALEDSTASD